ncbi:PD-(D/E)XK nuclease family protein [Patescibacteria group bacterium]|nr:PD-(D/E)XK nuclease family protein [Patescibacteria group bacterium]MBU4078083.1 PD-(D/E)XK nuclease family protein [Patescibacteria group bacterium]
MSFYYNPKRTTELFDVKKKTPFRISRSKIDLFLQCPRCFYIDRRLGIARPPGFPFNLNNAVDSLLKKEFDIHRAEKSKHPLMEEYGVDAIPFEDKRMNDWRNTRSGIKYIHKPTNLLIMGGIDDIWVNPKGEIHIVDYKATSKNGEVSLDAPWQIAYKRQMEIYQWLFRKNDFNVSKIGYFVYCNGITDTKAFDKKIEFDVKVIPYEGDDSWVEGTIKELHQCLLSKDIPKMADDCDYCRYRKVAAEESYKDIKKRKKKK